MLNRSMSIYTDPQFLCITKSHTYNESQFKEVKTLLKDKLLINQLH